MWHNVATTFYSVWIHFDFDFDNFIRLEHLLLDINTQFNATAWYIFQELTDFCFSYINLFLKNQFRGIGWK
jgi:hypothetical protein